MRWWDWFQKPQRRPDALLRGLVKRRAQVVVEIEHLNLRFHTFLALKGRHAVVARPRQLEKEIRAGSWLRIYHPGLLDAGFRLRIINPRFLLGNGNTVIVADLPDALVEPNRRQQPRHDTARFGGLGLMLPLQSLRFPVLDLSPRGCRLRVERGIPVDVLPPGQLVPDAFLSVGRRFVRLQYVTPRVHAGDAVGCAFEVAQDGRSPYLLEHFIKRLDREERERYQVDPAI